MRKLLWQYDPNKCLICNKLLWIYDQGYTTGGVAKIMVQADTYGQSHGALCLDCAKKLFKEKKKPTVTWNKGEVEG